MNFNTIRKGNRVTVRVGNEVFGATFLGFSNIKKKYSSTPRFDTLKDAKDHFNVRRNSELEDVGDDLGYGHNVYAIFKDIDDGMVWRAYLFQGKWIAGSSATPVRLR